MEEILKDRDYIAREEELTKENNFLKIELNTLKKNNLKKKFELKEKNFSRNRKKTTYDKKRVSLLNLPKFKNFVNNLDKTKTNLQNELDLNIVNRKRQLSEKDVENRNRRT